MVNIGIVAFDIGSDKVMIVVCIKGFLYLIDGVLDAIRPFEVQAKGRNNVFKGGFDDG